MKIVTLSLVAIFLAIVACGQSQEIGRDELLFEKAIVLQELVDDDLDLDDFIGSNDTIEKKMATGIKETILEKAHEYYQELADSFPMSKLVFRTLNNMGFIELALGDRKEAKATYLKVLNSGADDKEKGGVGSGIMGEPYANYKNRAAKILADISIRDSNYKEALGFLDLTKKYPYRHFCGNEYAASEIYMAELYAQTYNGLKDTQKALSFLLPHLIENGLADNQGVVVLTYKTLLHQYSKEELKSRYEKAFEHYKVEKIRSGKEKIKQYSINFLGTWIVLPSWWLDFVEGNEERKEIATIYKRSGLYRQLHKEGE
jgi:tetratricopeptide (TPR) repeat protein